MMLLCGIATDMNVRAMERRPMNRAGRAGMRFVGSGDSEYTVGADFLPVPKFREDEF